MSACRTYALFTQKSADRSGMIEKVRRIQDAAALKKSVDKIKDDPQHLAHELHRAGLEIARLQKEVESYKQLAAVTEERLVEMQEQCQSKEATMLSTLIGWHMNQMKIRQPH
jgi:predicted  nucleic acid-binding Zn-ribbon protein